MFRSGQFEWGRFGGNAQFGGRAQPGGCSAALTPWQRATSRRRCHGRTCVASGKSEVGAQAAISAIPERYQLKHHSLEPAKTASLVQIYLDPVSVTDCCEAKGGSSDWGRE